MLDRRAFATGLAAAGLVLRAASAAPRLALRILPGDGEEAAATLALMRERWPSAVVMESGRRPGDLAGAAVYVALGPRSLALSADAEPGSTVVALLVSRQGYERTARELGARGVLPTAVYAEASPAQQMRLIAAIFRRTVAVGVLVSPAATAMLADLRQAADAARLDLEVVHASPAIPLSRSLQKLQRVAVVLVFPDATLYTPSSLRELLEASYRRRLPVVGFSPSLVRAGTLATAYADAAGLVAQLSGV
ncbi:hypothetical protein CLD22_26820, partial [Rubrivivax gelatinosus]|nr:hypothetical protein [Rubrivivax gelatinosus]